MIKLKNIIKVLLVALFVCVYSGNVWAEGEADTKVPPQTKNQVSACDSLDSQDQSDSATFKELICTGKLIFYRLRDLIYVVAGFGIIAVAVGGFFGNLNWKWLGAIIISLVVIASAGELLALLTGGGGTAIVTNTLQYPTTLQVGAGADTGRYNKNFIDDKEPEVDKRIKWDANVEREAAVNYNTFADTSLGVGGDDDRSEVGAAPDDGGNG